MFEWTPPAESSDGRAASALDALVMHLGDKIASDLFEAMSEPGHPMHRIQFMGGKYPDNEVGLGGMNKDAFTRYVSGKLKECLGA